MTDDQENIRRINANLPVAKIEDVTRKVSKINSTKKILFYSAGHFVNFA